MPYKNKADERAQKARYRAEHYDEIIAKQKVYTAKNYQKIYAYQRQWCAENDARNKKHKADWYAKNRDRLLAEAKAITAAKPKRVMLTPEEKKARRKAYALAHAAEIAENGKRRYRENIEYRKAQGKKYRKKNAAKFKAKYYANLDANRAMARASAKRCKAQREAYRAKRKLERPEHLKKLSRKRWLVRKKTWYPKYYLENYHKIVEWTRQRRTKIKIQSDADTTAIVAFYKHLKTAKMVRCHWCGKRVPMSRRTADHVIPIAKGGRHSAGNLVPACRRCNCSKSDKLPHEFKGQGEFDFSPSIASQSAGVPSPPATAPPLAH